MNEKLKVESGKFSFPSSPIGRGVSEADGEGVLEGRKIGGLEGKLFNDSGLSKIPRQSQTDTVLSPNSPNALSPDNKPDLHTSKIAFTLAEVLITLGIIGVVAAITMPTLIKNCENQVKLNKLKKFYSLFEQLFIRSIDENDGILSWSEEDLQNGSADNLLNQYIMPYLDNPKICKTVSGLCGYKNNLVYNKQGRVVFNPVANNNKLIILKDGSSVIFRPNKTNVSANGVSYRYYWDIYYDYNGKKEPNKKGEDIFVFQIHPVVKRFVPSGRYRSITTNEINSDENVTNNCINNGDYCAEKIIRDGWKIKY